MQRYRVGERDEKGGVLLRRDRQDTEEFQCRKTSRYQPSAAAVPSDPVPLFQPRRFSRTHRTQILRPSRHREERRSTLLLPERLLRPHLESSRVTLGLTAQRKFEEAEKARKCTLVADSTLERCKDLPLGEAAMVDSVPLAFEYRTLRRLFAISPKLVYDFKRRVAAASLPIYLLPDSTGRLTGRLWRGLGRTQASGRFRLRVVPSLAQLTRSSRRRPLPVPAGLKSLRARAILIRVLENSGARGPADPPARPPQERSPPSSPQLARGMAALRIG